MICAASNRPASPTPTIAVAADRSLEFAGLANGLTAHAGRALSTPDTEVAKDEWDLAVFGHSGTVSFTVISQG
jgi:hypothetical protein